MDNEEESSDESQNKASNYSRNNVREEENETIEYQNLNKNQKKVFNRIETHYNDILACNQVELLRILVMETAGTGKSYLIKAIRKRLHNMASTESKSSILVITPTGVAAFNINRSTIHSMLSISFINDNNVDLNSNKLKQLQERLKDVTYFIIDEKSIVGRRMLELIDTRLR